jgi:hypothetical protein
MTFYIAQCEHWSSGSASAIFSSLAEAKAAFYGNSDSIGESDAPLETLIEIQEHWLENAENRIGHYDASTPEIEPIEVAGALWAAHRK